MTRIPVETIRDTLDELLAAQRRLDAQHAETTDRARNGYRHTVTLARQYGLSWADIAHHLGTTPEAARKRYARGL